MWKPKNDFWKPTKELRKAKERLEILLIILDDELKYYNALESALEITYGSQLEARL